jgi:general secretion pathway protein A
MYKKFFGLKESPFNVNPDPRYLFMTRHTQEALACLTYGIESRKGFILLTGEVGTGKTTLINKLLEWLQKERVSTAFVFNPRLSVTQFFDFMMADFGIPCESQQKGQMLQKLNHWLLERYQAGERAVLIVDEAQNLSPQMLEEIRLLTNLETSTEKLLQIVLAGQPELQQKLNQPDLRQLRQRITLRAKTRQLTLDETQGYIQERLRIAGAENLDIFSPEAIATIHHYARGIARVTNLLCEHSLISAFVDQRNPVPAEIVEEVARDFELHIIDPLAQTPAQPFPPQTNGDHPPLVDSLLQAVNTLMERLKQAEAGVESEPENKKALNDIPE